MNGRPLERARENGTRELLEVAASDGFWSSAIAIAPNLREHRGWVVRLVAGSGA
jgi:hypothetical protein